MGYKHTDYSLPGLYQLIMHFTLIESWQAIFGAVNQESSPRLFKIRKDVTIQLMEKG
jgi:hypothetical protein